jgi:hypothetical protein
MGYDGVWILRGIYMSDFGRRGKHGAAQTERDTGNAKTDWAGRYASLREPRTVEGLVTRQPGILETVGNGLHRVKLALDKLGL